MATKKATSAKKTAAKKTATKKVVAKKSVAPAKTTAGSAKAKGGYNIKPSALIAEFFGTFLLAGAATVFLNKGIEYMLAIIALVVIFAVLSGAHFNPAITFAAWLNKKINLPKAGLFIVAQLLGAALAFFAIQGFTNEQNATYAEDGSRSVATLQGKLLEQGITQEQLDEAGGAEAWLETGGYNISDISKQLGIATQYKVPALESHKELFAFWAELIGSIILGLGAGFALLKAKKPVIRGIAYGGAVMVALALVGGTAVLNPAVAFSLGGYTASVWPYIIYILAPIIGITIGFSLYNVILKDSGCDGDEDCTCNG
ncbi:MAG: aquaporin [Candidatus Nomurabacteria bacterium]|jgi:glycerol uptake facilitator-like aquaporin|nr:aquaporin [Candidatus Nomurabacteria bacterium]